MARLVKPDSDFSPQDSASRLALVQKYLLDVEDGTDHLLLIVPGIDGKYNAGSQQLIKYLFLGASGRSLSEPTISEEAWEDCFLGISKNAVKIFYNQKVSKRVVLLTSLWQNVKEYTLLKTDHVDDAEKQELFKVQSFIDIVSNHQNILVPHLDDVSSIETWPLVQGYGLDELGSRGFLTQKKKVLSVFDKFQLLLSHVDSVACKQIYEETKNQLMLHWKTTLSQLTKPGRKKLSEYKVAEPLISFYEYGRVRIEEETECGRGSYCRFGERTGELDNERTKEPYWNCHEHFVITGEDPSTGVRAKRTYFQRKTEDSTLCVYGALVLAQRKVMSIISSSPQENTTAKPYLFDMSRSRAEGRLKQVAAKVMIDIFNSNGLTFNEESLKLKISSFDPSGKSVTPGDNIRSINFIELSYGNLPDGKGAVSIGDTFITLPDENEVLNLTKNAETFCILNDGEPSAEIQEDLTLGSLKARSSCFLLFERPCWNKLKAKVDIFEKGMKLYLPQLAGSLPILSIQKHVQSLTQLLCNNTSTMMVIELTTAAAKQKLDKLCIFDGNLKKICVLMDSNLRCDIPDLWRKTKEVEVENFPNDGPVSSSFEQTYREICLHEPVSLTEIWKMYALKDTGIVPSSCEFENSDTSKSKLDVFIVSGIPGSGKEFVASLLGDHMKASVVQNKVAQGTKFDKARLRKSIPLLCKKGEKKVVLVCPGSTSTFEIIQFLNELNMETRVVSSICVVSAPFAYSDSRRTQLVPGLLAQCAAGWVDSIFMTGTAKVDPSQLERLQDRLAAWNPLANFYRISSSFVTDVYEKNALDAAFRKEMEEDEVPFDKPKLVRARMNTQVNMKSQNTFSSNILQSSNMYLNRVRLTKLFERLTTRGVGRVALRSMIPEQKNQYDDENDFEPLSENNSTENLTGLRRAQFRAKAKVQQRLEAQKDRKDIANITISNENPILQITGFVRFDSEKEKVYRCNAVAGKVKLSPVDDAAELGTSSVKLCFVSERNDQNGWRGSELTELVQICQPRLNKEKQILSIDSLTKKQQQEINKQIPKSDLPSGFWFDGSMFVNHTGTQFELHPNFEAHAKAWMQKQNSLIAEDNKIIEKQRKIRNKKKLSYY